MRRSQQMARSGPGGLFFAARLNIRTKLIIIFLAVSIVPLIILTVFSYELTFRNIERNSLDNFSNLADQLNKNIELVLMESRNYLKLSQSDEVQNFLTKSNSPESEYENALAVVNLFKTYRRLFDYDDYIANIVILNRQGKHISEQRGVYTLPVHVERLAVVRRIRINPDAISIIPSSHQDYVVPERSEKLLSICSVIRKPITHEEVGYIIVNLKMDVIHDLVKTISVPPSGDFFIAEDVDSIIYPADYVYAPEHLQQRFIDLMGEEERGFFPAEFRGSSSFFVFNTLELTGWKIVGRSDRRELLKDAIAIKNISLTVVALTVTLSVLLYIYLSFRLTLPIKKLKSCMQEVEQGNLQLEAEVYSHDEIADLSASFNSMVQKIRDLIELTIKEQKLSKKMEFKALQAQINPHFLYNSLESILWMAEAGKKEDIITMTKSLSAFFRIILSKGDEKIPVRDEISHIRSYLMIQKLRYRDILNYEIDVPQELGEYRIIKLLLQPLVENALYHGIKNTRVRGEVRIIAREEGELIAFTVTDNGTGMDEAVLSRIRGEIENFDDETTGHTSYGLRNISQRLKLEYGERGSLTIKSAPGRGTTVTITIPKENQDV
jgi:two-component system, sensor histidine kinase YesM